MSGESQQQTASSERLAEIANPKLYQLNSFRVLGLSTLATVADIRKHQKRLRRQESLGIAAEGSVGCLPLKPPPDAQDLRDAMHRLQNPVTRLFDEFFWFWPEIPGDADDEGLKLLSQNNIQKAQELWLKTERKSLTNWMAATHNLAVLYHVIALDSEPLICNDPISEKQNVNRLASWKRTYERWRLLVEHQPFWDRVQSRVTEMNDATLSLTSASEIRDSLSEAILAINTQLALNAFQEGSPDIAEEHVRFVKESNFDDSIIRSTAHRCLRPLRHQLTSTCQEYDEDARRNIKLADGKTNDFLKQIRPVLQIFDALLPSENLVRTGAHDLVAETALGCVVSFANETENWQSFVDTMSNVNSSLSPCESVRNRVVDQIAVVRDNLDSSICIYCGNPEHSRKENVAFHSNVRVEGNVVKWDKLSVPLPQCTRCARNDDRSGAIGAIAILLFFGSLFSMCGGWVGDFNGLLIFGIVIFLGFSASIAASITLMTTVNTDHPTISKLLSEGWEFGTEPIGEFRDATNDQHQFNSGAQSNTAADKTLTNSGKRSTQSIKCSCPHCQRINIVASPNIGHEIYCIGCKMLFRTQDDSMAAMSGIATHANQPEESIVDKPELESLTEKCPKCGATTMDFFLYEKCPECEFES